METAAVQGVSVPPARSLLASGLLAAWLVAPPAAAAEARSYRADALALVPPGVPEQVDLLLAPGVEWPEPARQALAERVRREWPRSGGREQSYGAVHTGVGLYVDYPLVTARVGRRVVLPVLESGRLPIAGRLALRADPAAERRVVLLVDASSSANALTRFENPDGSVEHIPVLEAQFRAIEHLLERLGDDWLEFGIIAFGESTWPIVRPGASTRTVRERLAEFRREHPRGEGRTDTVCALETAAEWLDSTPRGVGREIVLLTDGDTPHSGRFIRCDRGSREARERCEERRNRTACPVRIGGRRSDEVMMARLGRRLRKKLRISPVVFEHDRRARAYRVLAEDTGGEFVQVPSAQGIEVALPPLVAGRIRGVFARNLATGERTGDLLGGLPGGLPGGLLTEAVSTFEGALGLVEGPNDVELEVRSDRGTAALMRFRVYRAEQHLSRYLAGLRERNRELEARVDDLAERARELLPDPPERELRVAPAAPAD